MMGDMHTRVTKGAAPSHYLNLGSGSHYAEGWCNVDLHVPPEGCRPPDWYANVYQLDKHFNADTFSRVYLGHFLEHLEWDRIPAAFEQICRVAVDGAAVMAVGPCLYRAIRTGQPIEIIEAMFPDPRGPRNGSGHAWMPTEELTIDAMRGGGLADVVAVPVENVAPPFWPNPSMAPWQTAVSGYVVKGLA